MRPPNPLFRKLRTDHTAVRSTTELVCALSNHCLVAHAVSPGELLYWQGLGSWGTIIRNSPLVVYPSTLMTGYTRTPAELLRYAQFARNFVSSRVDLNDYESERQKFLAAGGGGPRPNSKTRKLGVSRFYTHQLPPSTFLFLLPNAKRVAPMASCCRKSCRRV